MSYIDKYPDCIGCPVSKYCGTMVGSIKLCHSCDDDTPSPVLVMSKSHSVSENDDIEAKLTMWDNCTE